MSFLTRAEAFTKAFTRARELTLKHGVNVVFLDELKTDHEKEIDLLHEKISNMEEVLEHRAQDIVQRTKTTMELRGLLFNLAARHNWQEDAECQCLWHTQVNKLL